MDISFTDTSENDDVLVMVVFADQLKADTGYKTFDHNLNHAIANDAHFAGKRGQTLTVPALENSGFKKVILLGAGNAASLTEANAEELGGTLLKAIRATGFHSIAIHGTPHLKHLPHEVISASLANGLLLKDYTFDKYKTGKATKPLSIKMLTENPARAEELFKPKKEVSAGAYLARDVANEPPNALYPESFATKIDSELSPLGVKITVLDEKELERIGAGGILAVGQGSARPPRLVIMEYNGTGKTGGKPDLALVGKGITFDTGGISIKPSSGMASMKYDMGGAAAVVGTMRALAGRQANAHVVAVVALAENMPGGNAYRPGDIITSLSGKTVEIDNTDAEGRLVLMDALTYVQRNYKPKTVIDLATLTGAVRVALGNVMAGIFSNTDTLWKQINKAGNAVNEPGWRLPLHQRFTQAMQSSDFADLTNSTPGGGGSSTAAAFLEQFIEKGTKWAHCDIAAMASGSSGHALLPDRIGNGFGVRLLDRLVRDAFEKPKDIPVKPCGPVCTGTCPKHQP